MSYRNLISAFGNRMVIATELKVRDNVVSMWGQNGLPRKYATRLRLIDAVERLDCDPKLKQICLEYVKDPAN